MIKIQTRERIEEKKRTSNNKKIHTKLDIKNKWNDNFIL